MTTVQRVPSAKKRTAGQILVRDFKKNKYIYLIVLPVVVYLIIFAYKPMYGVVIAFKDFKGTRGIWGSPWVGLKHFRDFFSDIYFWRLLRNTFLISLYFPVPILFALLLNEVRAVWYKKLIQTSSYLPHFISMVIICSLIRQFSYSNGLFNDIAEFFGGTRKPFLQYAGYFRTIYVASGIWQEFGWSSIIYLAALTGVDQELYEAARIDGADRWRQTLHITLPSITPTIVILLILRMGSILGVGYEKIMLLYNERTYETADVIATYTYRRGLVGGEFSYSAAIGLFNSCVNLFFLVATNMVSRRVSDVSLW